MATTMDAIELSKENVQPLRRGRNPDALNTALGVVPGAGVGDVAGKPGVDAAAAALAEQKRCVSISSTGMRGHALARATARGGCVAPLTTSCGFIRIRSCHRTSPTNTHRPPGGGQRTDIPKRPRGLQGGCAWARGRVTFPSECMRAL
jgi:hypothetical protein